jgi:hypothetical protein
LQRLAAARLSGRHQSLSDGTLRRCLPEAGSSVLDHIQTGADLFSAENIDNRVNEREQSHKDEDMMTRIHKATEGRIQNDPRINLMGERVDRAWADPILNPNRNTVR